METQERPKAIANKRSWNLTSDFLAGIVIVFSSCLAVLLKSINDDWLFNYDTFGYFLPTFGYLGDRLHQLELPAWNPYSFSGAPLIGDPASGWMYFPVMLSFALLPVVAAFKALVLGLAVISGIALYAFGRTIGFSPLPALFASVAFAIGPIVYGMASDGIAVTMTYPTIAVGLLATERALLAPRLSTFLGWVSLAAISLTHNLASWPTNGVLYVAMYLGGWLAYRGIVDPLPQIGDRLANLRKCVYFGIATGSLTTAFAGAVLWPTLTFSNQSPIAGADYSNVEGLVQSPSLPILDLLAFPLLNHASFGVWSPGGAVIILALVALILGRNRFGTFYFATMTWIFVDLSANESILRPAFDLVPFFSMVHDHRPATMSTMIYPAILLLSAAGIQAFLTQIKIRVAIIAIGLATAVFTLFLWICHQNDLQLSTWAVAMAYVTAVLLTLALIYRDIHVTWPRWPGINLRPGPLVAIVLVLSFYLNPIGTDALKMALGVNLLNETRTEDTPGVMPELTIPTGVDGSSVVETTFRDKDPGTAAEFLQRQQALQQPFRYASYWGADTLVTHRGSPEFVASLAHSRSAALQLQNVSGYNPISLKAYGEYIELMNGKSQDYHFADVYWPALDYPQLLSMLNVRYVIVTVNLGFTPPIANYGREVYRDNLVIVYENPSVFPRAWIAHDVRSSTEPESYLREFDSYLLDGRHVAFVEGQTPPATFPDTGLDLESALVTSYSPEEIVLQTSSRSPGLLVLSEIYADGWHAYIDNEKVDVLRTNHILRGVPLPAGDHEVVIKYLPRSLQIGLWSTGLSGLGMTAIWCWATVDRRRHHQEQTAQRPG